MSKRSASLRHRLLAQRIKANERFRRADAKHERQMRESSQREVKRESEAYRRVVAQQYAKDRVLDDEHFERLNNADKTAEKIAAETKEVAKETAASALAAAKEAKEQSVSKDTYLADWRAHDTLREAEKEAQRIKDNSQATITSLKQGRAEGVKQVFGLSNDAFRLGILLITGISALIVIAKTLRWIP